MTFTRAARRRIARRAPQIARAMARTVEHRLKDGRSQNIRDPRAVAALERGFKSMLRNGGRPIVIELNAEEGDALRHPERPPAPPLPGVRHWAAFGLDVEGEATFVSQYTMIRGLPEEEERAEAERIALEELGAACATAGLPAGGAR